MALGVEEEEIFRRVVPKLLDGEGRAASFKLSYFRDDFLPVEVAGIEAFLEHCLENLQLSGRRYRMCHHPTKYVHRLARRLPGSSAVGLPRISMPRRRANAPGPAKED
jgi:hypothetical protein